MGRADQALYQAKRAGRDQSVIVERAESGGSGGVDGPTDLLGSVNG